MVKRRSKTLLLLYLLVLWLNRLINIQSTFDVIIGIGLTIGLVGGILCFKQYLSLRKVESDRKERN